MRKFITAVMIMAAIAACKNGAGSTAGSDSAMINTTPSSGDINSTLGQQIPTDSLEKSTDSTGNIHPGDTTKGNK